MKFGLFYDNIKEAAKADGITPEDILRKAAGLGLLQYIELNLGDFLKGEPSPDLLKELNIGLSICFHCSPEGRFLFDDQKPIEEYLPALMEAGVIHILLVPIVANAAEAASPDTFRKLSSSVSSFVQKARAAGIPVTFEDFDNVISPCGSGRDQLEYARAVPGLGITFDTGNYQYHAEDMMELFPVLADRILHVHVKDRVSRDPHSPSAVTGQGCLPLVEFLRQLKNTGYGSTLTAEMYGAAASQDAMISALQFLKKGWN